MCPAENECVFGSLRTLLEVLVKTCYNWASSDAVSVSVLSADMFLTIISVKILHKCDETSLTVTRITVSLTLKVIRFNPLTLVKTTACYSLQNGKCPILSAMINIQSQFANTDFNVYKSIQKKWFLIILTVSFSFFDQGNQSFGYGNRISFNFGLKTSLKRLNVSVFSGRQIISYNKGIALVDLSSIR